MIKDHYRIGDIRHTTLDGIDSNWIRCGGASYSVTASAYQELFKKIGYKYQYPATTYGVPNSPCNDGLTPGQFPRIVSMSQLYTYGSCGISITSWRVYDSSGWTDLFNTKYTYDMNTTTPSDYLCQTNSLAYNPPSGQMTITGYGSNNTKELLAYCGYVTVISNIQRFVVRYKTTKAWHDATDQANWLNISLTGTVVVRCGARTTYSSSSNVPIFIVEDNANVYEVYGCKVEGANGLLSQTTLLTKASSTRISPVIFGPYVYLYINSSVQRYAIKTTSASLMLSATHLSAIRNRTLVYAKIASSDAEYRKLLAYSGNIATVLTANDDLSSYTYEDYTIVTPSSASNISSAITVGGFCPGSGRPYIMKYGFTSANTTSATVKILFGIADAANEIKLSTIYYKTITNSGVISSYRVLTGNSTPSDITGNTIYYTTPVFEGSSVAGSSLQGYSIDTTSTVYASVRLLFPASNTGTISINRAHLLVPYRIAFPIPTGTSFRVPSIMEGNVQTSGESLAFIKYR